MFDFFLLLLPLLILSVWRFFSDVKTGKNVKFPDLGIHLQNSLIFPWLFQNYKGPWFFHDFPDCRRPVVCSLLQGIINLGAPIQLGARAFDSFALWETSPSGHSLKHFERACIFVIMIMEFIILYNGLLLFSTTENNEITMSLLISLTEKYRFKMQSKI